MNTNFQSPNLQREIIRKKYNNFFLNFHRLINSTSSILYQLTKFESDVHTIYICENLASRCRYFNIKTVQLTKFESDVHTIYICENLASRCRYFNIKTVYNDSLY